VCDDGVDNDGDGKTDYRPNPGQGDDDCLSRTDSSENAACSDGVDNDGDGATDHSADPGCTGPNDADEHGPAKCDNGINDDSSTGTDYRPDGTGDPDCDGPGDPEEAPECNDARDNDGDTFVDGADPGCASLSDDDETG
jgi:hypothetical protein